MAAPTPQSQTHDVIVTRVFEAPVEAVWQAWTDGEQVKRWWGPHGFTAPVARMDVRVGGRSLVSMRAPADFGGQEIFTTWTYREVDPPRRLEFVVHFADPDSNRVAPASLGLPAGIPDGVRHVITLRPVGDRRTEMHMVEYGYTTVEARDQSKLGLDQTLDKLAATFAAP